MERLTIPVKILEDGRRVMPIIDGRSVRDHAMDIYWRLKEYEDLEERGLLLKLPCKPGTVVYEIKKDLNDMKLKREFIKHNGHYYHRNINVYFITQVTFDIKDIAEFGKTIFLTKEEAEKALDEMEK